MRYVVLLSLLLAGCAGQDPRAGYLSATETVKVLYVASAQQYAACHAEAPNRESQDACYDAKNDRGETIQRAEPYLELGLHALLIGDQVQADGYLGQARALLAAIMASLTRHMPGEHAQAIAWLEATP